jgi:cyclophilin family peptidyl-prolyl cis-trans isomerase/HEAT repeat protein
MARLPLVLAVAVVWGPGLAGCKGSKVDREEPETRTPVVRAASRGAPVELTPTRELLEIAELENQRSLGEGRLVQLALENDDEAVRERAVVALGRMPFPRLGAPVTAALARALEDPASSVRQAAAFGMGIRGDASAAGTLLAYRNDPDARLRARVVEAASRLEAPEVRVPILLSLRDADLSVRMEAAVGTARWDTTGRDAGDVDRALLDALRPYRITPDAGPKTAVEAELVWRILWALGRRKSELGRGPFLEYAYSDVPLERLFALRGLGTLPPNEDAVAAAVNALVGGRRSNDWRVTYEAVAALGQFLAARKGKVGEAADTVLSALAAVSEHESPHVRAGVMESLGLFEPRQRVLSLLQRGRLDLSASVRAAAVRARARLSSPGDALQALTREAREEDPVLRAAVADAVGEIADERAARLLERLGADPSLLVSTRAVEALGKLLSVDPTGVRASLHRFLGNEDNGLRLAAVLGLAQAPTAADVGPLVEAFRSSTGDGAAEVAFNVLEALGKVGGEEAQRFVQAARQDPRPYVRSVARRIAREVFRLQPAPASSEPPVLDATPVPVPGRDMPLWRFNPMVEVVTSRGTMVFELFPAEAPVHVHNFLTLAEARAYDDLTFHRVVPDFVIQGGDYRGDGNGARPSAGQALRAEFTPRKYTRGSLGMPRNADPDSGGSQFFVTHLPTPHLDGRYTVFGELRAGGEVLDRIEVGDRILSIRRLQ